MGRGSAASRVNAVTSAVVQGQPAAMARRACRAVRAIRAATCSSRLRRFFGSAVARSPSSSRTRGQARGSMLVRAIIRSYC